MGITIVGLGPGRAELVTREAWELLAAADEVWLRTIRHPTVAGLPRHLARHSFDQLYESATDFPSVYRAIAEEVVRLGRRPQGVVYVVPGHPLVGEASVQQVLAAAQEENLPVRIVDGLSFVEPTLTALELDGLDGFQVCDGLELATLHHPPLNPDRPALIGQVYDRSIAADLKLTLMNQYPDAHPVALVCSAGTPEARVVHLPLYELDHVQVDHLTALYVPPVSPAGSFEALQETVAHLRSQDGCPWDREQSHESLRSALLEESFETLAAIDSGDVRDLCEELGDLLLQVLLHTQIATEEGEFRMADVIAGIDAKLKHRHPHVWGETEVSGPDDVVARWQHLKMEEKEQRISLLDGVPAALPALLQAHLYSERAARVGFDWPDAAAVGEKVREEMVELQSAQGKEEIEAEIGDLLFAVVNLARHHGVEAESALRRASQRFARRFRALEQSARRQGRDLSEMTIDELETLWQDVKGRGDTDHETSS